MREAGGGLQFPAKSKEDFVNTVINSLEMEKEKQSENRKALQKQPLTLGSCQSCEAGPPERSWENRTGRCQPLKNGC
ncbi:unnamed protein product [Caretta caretta]